MILALLFRAFIDDSADRRQKVAVVAGAFVSSHREWGKFSINWKRLLKTHGIKYFRSTEYYGLSGEFAKFRDPVQFPSPKGREAATRVLTDLERLIQSSKLRGMIAIIPVQTYKHFRSTVAGASVTLNEDAFAAALQSMILECAALVREKIPGHHRITFVCDDGPKSAIYSAVYANFKIKNANVAQIMGGLTHLDDKKHPPLQAADMMASIGRDEALSLIQNPPEIEWRVLKNGSKRRMPRIERIPSRLSPNIFQNIHFWDWPLLEKILEVQS